MKKLFLIVIALLVGLQMSAAGVPGKRVKKVYPIPDDGKQYVTDTSTVTAKTFNRGIKGPRVIFSPKGNLSLGVKVAYSGEEDKALQLLQASPLTGHTKELSVIPQIFYTFKHNHSIGLQFDYNWYDYRCDNGLISEKVEESLKGTMSQNVYTGRIAYRFYNPIANSRRIALIMGGFIGLGGGNGKVTKTSAGEKELLYNISSFNCSIFFAPGIAIAISDLMMFEACLEVLGVSYEKIVQTGGDLSAPATQETLQARYKPSLLSLKLGVSFQIPLF